MDPSGVTGRPGNRCILDKRRMLSANLFQDQTLENGLPNKETLQESEEEKKSRSPRLPSLTMTHTHTNVFSHENHIRKVGDMPSDVSITKVEEKDFRSRRKQLIGLWSH